MIIYRYLLFEYLKVFGLCVASFIAILLTTRLEEIAYFAAAGGKGWTILKFILLQIPYVLPIVIPIASLVSAIVLSLRLSHSQELTTLRSSGLSMMQILAPVLITAGFLSLFNFYIVSQIATESVLQTRMLQRQLTLVNPLTLIRQKDLIRHKDLYISTQNPALSRNSLEGVTVGVWNKAARRINLIIAKELVFEEPMIKSRLLTMFSSFLPNKRNDFDNLYLENVADSSMDVEGFSLYLKQRATKLNDDYLKMGMLLSYMQVLKEILHQEGVDKKEIRIKMNRVYSEILRRIAMGLTVFSLTFLGASFGISTGRQPTFRSAYYVIGLASILLVCIFSAKAVMANVFLTACLYFIPNLVIILLSIWNLNRVSRGIE